MPLWWKEVFDFGFGFDIVYSLTIHPTKFFYKNLFFKFFLIFIIIMFKDTIFNNDTVINQSYSFEYMVILSPLNTQTKIVINTLEKLIAMGQETGGD